MTALTITNPEDDNDDNSMVPNGEHGGALCDLMALAQEQHDLAFQAHKRVATHVWQMGKFLIEAKGKHEVLKKKLGKAHPNWEVTLKQFGISIASDNRARTLAENISLEEITGRTITEAYDIAGISIGLVDKSKTNGQDGTDNQNTADAKSLNQQVEQNPEPETETDVGADELNVVKSADVEDDDLKDNVALINGDDESDDDYDDSNLTDDDDKYKSDNLIERLHALAVKITAISEPQATAELLDEDVEAALLLIERIAGRAFDIKLQFESRLPSKA